MFSKFFIERPRFAVVIAIVMALAGLVSVFTMPIGMYPEIAPPESSYQPYMLAPVPKLWLKTLVFRWKRTLTVLKICCICHLLLITLALMSFPLPLKQVQTLIWTK